MKAKKKGLQQRWLRNTLSIVLAVVLLCVTALSITVAAYYYSNMQAGMESRARTSTSFFENYIGQTYNEFYRSCAKFAETFEDKDIIELQFVNTSNRVVASSYGQYFSKTAVTSDIAQAIETKQMAVYSGSNPATDERIMAVSSPIIYSNGEVIGVLRYVTSLQRVDMQIVLFSVVIAVVGLFVLLIVYMSGKYYIKTILLPVSEITATAKRIAAGSYGVQISKKFDDEIGALTETINDMSNKIAQSEKMQSEFISSISHELRTPLTAISGWSETLIAGGESMRSADARRGLSIILSESKRLTGMVEEMLEITRLQDGRITLNVKMCDIRAEFEDTIFMYGSRSKQDGIELVYIENDKEIPEIPCAPERIRQVFLNILDNAAKHGGDGKKITAEIDRDDASVIIRIRDFGPGIPEEELPFIKKKFYKGTSKARGSGIGLAVCEEIVSLHDGSLDIENADGGGTLVTVRLPIGQK
ncbi:MAG: HAMP domain-containing histidine kinase [Oscillospiraceae bacterium]|jgi:signal transduction histidine kinase|nr:HAMP domain-containing histidine kinase [Oscillospiraceae bacterium]